MTLRRIWIATLLSGCVHAAFLGFLGAAAWWARNTPPQLLEAYGDSDREGFPLEVITENPGTFRKGLENTPGGDGIVTPVPPEPPSAPPLPMVAPYPVAPKPEVPEKPPEVEKPAAPTPPEPSPPAPPEKPAESEKPIVEPPPPAPAPDKPSPPAGSSAPSKPTLPTAPGGSRLALGSPSAGGTVGSRTGVRMAGAVLPPRYPAEAREQGMEGTPVIYLRISEEGHVLEARLYKSCGYQVLDDAALRWARVQRFIPAHQGNTAVEAEVLKPVNFSLY